MNDVHKREGRVAASLSPGRGRGIEGEGALRPTEGVMR